MLEGRAENLAAAEKTAGAGSGLPAAVAHQGLGGILDHAASSFHELGNNLGRVVDGVTAGVACVQHGMTSGVAENFHHVQHLFEQALPFVHHAPMGHQALLGM